ncbi:MAG: tyrosine recombinase XerC [Pseudomonadota bacterium]|nr:tyrosine recombinase XerC [Pseudomonadota bacterium]
MPLDLKPHIEVFVWHLEKERRLSPHTVNAYRRDLRLLTNFCEQTSLGIESLDSYAVRQFAAECHRRGSSPRSIARRLSAIRGFLAFMVRKGIIKSNPASDVQAPKPSRRLPATLDADQVASLLALAGEDDLTVRDRAMLELFYSSGLRLAELVGVDLSDLDFPDRTVRVTGKGNKVRIVPVGRYALEALETWIVVRVTIAKPQEVALFVSRRGTRLAPRTVQSRLKRWAQQQGAPAGVHPHMLRHSFASHILESSGNLRAVQELLGHASISTTQVYTHLDFQHLAQIYDEAHPRAQRRDDEGTAEDHQD